MNELNQQATRYRRIVVIDIETISTDPYVPRGALDGLTAQVVCIGLVIDDGVRLTELAIVDEDESKVLKEFWGSLQPTDILVGHNALDFDLPILRQRSWIRGIRPSRSVDLRRYYTADVKDTMHMWTNWGFKKGVTLDALAAALGCGQKIGHGIDVADWWGTRDLRSIGEYCLQDCWLTYQVFCKLTFQEARARYSRPELPAITAGRTQEPAVRCRRRVRQDSPVLPDTKPA
jgi:predicted PolB exonuclease-like 3'-5' exonuclease